MLVKVCTVCVPACMCVYVCTCVCACVCMYVRVYVYVCVRMYVCMCMCVYVSTCVCACVCVSVCMPVRVSAHVLMCTCVFVYTMHVILGCTLFLLTYTGIAQAVVTLNGTITQVDTLDGQLAALSASLAMLRSNLSDLAAGCEVTQPGSLTCADIRDLRDELILNVDITAPVSCGVN